MEQPKKGFVKKIGGVTFIVNVKQAENAKQTAEEYVKALIIKESMALEADCA